MLFYPKRSKFKKLQKGSLSNTRISITNIKNQCSNSIKIVSNEHGKLTTKQLIAMRFLLRKSIKKKGLAIFKVFPQTIVTKKPAGIRMGKGKGSTDHWICKLSAGVLICEIFFKLKLKRKIMRSLRKVQIRLPIKTKIS